MNFRGNSYGPIPRCFVFMENSVWTAGLFGPILSQKSQFVGDFDHRQAHLGPQIITRCFGEW